MIVTDEDLKEVQYKSYANDNFDRDMNNFSKYEEQRTNMAKEQLDLSEELERIEHLLRGHVLKVNEQTKEREWCPPDDNDMVVLSEHGIHLVLNAITWYINKNTLLSNYDEDTILHKMKDFALDLTDTIFIEYEKVFQYPTLDDCKKVLNQRIDYKMQIKMFASELVGQKLNKEEVRDKIIKEMENTVEKELDKIKQQIIKSKLKRFILIIRCVQDAVHSTYLRAYKGMERKTLRENINITENTGMGSQPQQQRQGGVFGWITGRR